MNFYSPNNGSKQIVNRLSQSSSSLAPYTVLNNSSTPFLTHLHASKIYDDTVKLEYAKEGYLTKVTIDDQ